MGCWNEIDPITNTSIEAGDSVVAVLLSESGMKRPWWHGSWWQIYDDVEGVFKGTYDYYGWIHEHKSVERLDFRSVLFHKFNWDAIIQEFGVTDRAPFRSKFDVISARWSLDEDGRPQHLDELVAIMSFASRCKISLSAGFAYKGHQTDYKDEIKHHRFRQKLVDDGLKVMKKVYLDRRCMDHE